LWTQAIGILQKYTRCSELVIIKGVIPETTKGFNLPWQMNTLGNFGWNGVTNFMHMRKFR